MDVSSDRRSMKYKTCFCRTDNPVWEDIEFAIRLLDQELYSEVTITLDEDNYMGIGGGNGDYWIFTYSPTFSHQPYDESKPDEEILVRCGGQLIDPNRRELLGLEEALLVAKHYFETGEPSPTIKWG